MAELWNIDHETGDLSQYDSTVTDGGDLSVTNAAALAGTTWGLDINIDDGVAIYGVKNQGDTGTRKYRLRFYIDPNSLSMNDNMNHVILDQRSTAGLGRLFRSYLHKQPANYAILLQPFSDAAALAANLQGITDDPHYIEIYAIQAANAVAADGSVQWWIDGVLMNTWNNVDNYDTFLWMSALYVGAVLGIDFGTLGVYYIDQLLANDDGSEIGPYVAPAAAGKQSHGLWIEHPERLTGLRRWSIY